MKWGRQIETDIYLCQPKIEFQLISRRINQGIKNLKVTLHHLMDRQAANITVVHLEALNCCRTECEVKESRA